MPQMICEICGMEKSNVRALCGEFACDDCIKDTTGEEYNPSQRQGGLTVNARDALENAALARDKRLVVQRRMEIVMVNAKPEEVELAKKFTEEELDVMEDDEDTANPPIAYDNCIMHGLPDICEHGWHNVLVLRGRKESNG